MECINFISHDGKEILFLNIAHCKAAEALKTIDEAKKVIRSTSENSLLVLTDVTDGTFNTEVSEAMKEFAAHNKPYVKASAIVGITGLKRIIFDSVVMFSKRNIRRFDDIDSAKNWLVKDL